MQPRRNFFFRSRNERSNLRFHVRSLTQFAKMPRSELFSDNNQNQNNWKSALNCFVQARARGIVELNPDAVSLQLAFTRRFMNNNNNKQEEHIFPSPCSWKTSLELLQKLPLAVRNEEMYQDMKEIISISSSCSSSESTENKVLRYFNENAEARQFLTSSSSSGQQQQAYVVDTNMILPLLHSHNTSWNKKDPIHQKMFEIVEKSSLISQQQQQSNKTTQKDKDKDKVVVLVIPFRVRIEIYGWLYRNRKGKNINNNPENNSNLKLLEEKFEREFVEQMETNNNNHHTARRRGRSLICLTELDEMVARIKFSKRTSDGCNNNNNEEEEFCYDSKNDENDEIVLQNCRMIQSWISSSTSTRTQQQEEANRKEAPPLVQLLTFDKKLFEKAKQEGFGFQMN